MTLSGRFRGCKFDGVANEVGNNLTQAKRVTDKLVGNVGLDIVSKVEIILRGTNDECLEDAEDRLTE
jgi:hypothetical protein